MQRYRAQLSAPFISVCKEDEIEKKLDDGNKNQSGEWILFLNEMFSTFPHRCVERANNERNGNTELTAAAIVATTNTGNKYIV